MAGPTITVALVLMPQSMAYAQLAGMPAYYGLYAAFLPVAVAALWGSVPTSWAPARWRWCRC
jgi:MFS superfamily sulfate permease-like transporter